MARHPFINVWETDYVALTKLSHNLGLPIFVLVVSALDGTSNDDADSTLGEKHIIITVLSDLKLVEER